MSAILLLSEGYCVTKCISGGKPALNESPAVFSLSLSHLLGVFDHPRLRLPQHASFFDYQIGNRNPRLSKSLLVSHPHLHLILHPSL